VFVTSISLFRWYEANNVEQYSESAQIALVNISHMVRSMDSSLKSIGFLAAREPEIARMLHSRTRDHSRHGDLYNRLRNLHLIHDVIDSVCLVNQRADWIIGSPLPEARRAGEYYDFIRGMIQGENAIVRLNTYRDGGGGTETDVVSYVFFTRRSPDEDDSFLIINIRQSSFMAVLDAMDNMGGELTVLDSDGNIVFCHDSVKLYDGYGSPEMLERVYMGGASGYFVYGQGSERMLISYVNCARTRFTYITQTPYEYVLGASNALRGRTVLLSALILLCGIIAAVLLARHFYAPLRRLAEKHILRNPSHQEWIASQYGDGYELIDKFFEETYHKTISLENFVGGTIPVIRQDYLKKLLEGKIRLGLDLTQRLLEDVNISFEFKDFQVIVFSLDGKSDERSSFLHEISGSDPALKQQICAIAQETFISVCPNEAVWDTSDDYAVLILNHSGIEKPYLEAVCSAVQKRAGDEAGVLLSVAVGYVTAGDIHPSYKNALELLLYKIKYGSGAVLSPEKILADIEGENLFPEAECDRLIAALKNLSVLECEKAVREIVQGFYKYSINDILQALNHILYKAFFVMGDMIRDKTADVKRDFFYTYDMLMCYSSLDELESTLGAFFTGMVTDLKYALDEKTPERAGNIDHICDYIKKEYRNPNLSLDFIADYANLNPSYLGRIFHESTGVRFTEYISRLRLEAAKELLIGTSESVNHIARLVGFNSAAYFITCFKKHTGVTPSKFR